MIASWSQGPSVCGLSRYTGNRLAVVPLVISGDKGHLPTKHCISIFN